MCILCADRSFVGRLVLSSFLLSLVVLEGRAAGAVDDDHEFMPLHGGRLLGQSGEDDATSMLAEGFAGMGFEPSKDRWREPIDGSGGQVGHQRGWGLCP